MKMIAHLAPRLHFPARLSARFTQSLQETLTILIVTENRFATVTAVDDVVNSAGILHAQLSGHDRSFSTSPQSVNIRLCGTDPFARRRMDAPASEMLRDSVLTGCLGSVQMDSGTGHEKIRIYTDRAVGRDRHHCHPGRFAVARTKQVQGEGAGHRLREQRQATDDRLVSLYRRRAGPVREQSRSR